MTRLDWKRAPEVSPTIEEGDGAEPVAEGGRFSISAFARLMAVLTMIDEVRSALVESGLASTREQLDCSISPDSFWTTIVQLHFNDTSFRPDVDLRGIVDEVDAKEVPTRRWLGSELKKQYGDVRAQFTLSFNNWNVSGQMCATNFGDFCPRGKRDELTLVGKKALVMFTMYKCGTPHQFTDILNFTLRTVPASVSLETGVSGKGSAAADMDRRRVRKRKGDALTCFELMNIDLGRIASVCEKMGVEGGGSVGETFAEKMEIQKRRLQVNLKKKMKNLGRSFK